MLILHMSEEMAIVYRFFSCVSVNHCAAARQTGATFPTVFSRRPWCQWNSILRRLSLPHTQRNTQPPQLTSIPHPSVHVYNIIIYIILFVFHFFCVLKDQPFVPFVFFITTIKGYQSA